MYKKFLIGLFSVLLVTVATPSWARKLDLYECYTKIFKEALNRDIRPYSSTRWDFCSSFKTTYGWTDTQVSICVNGLTGFLEEAYAIIGNDEGDWEHAMQYFDNITELCEICLQGFYSPDIGVTDCEPCEPGYTTPDGEHIYYDEYSCAPCPAGTFWLDDEDYGYTCERCEPGQYSNTEGAEECKLCPNGTYTESGWGNTTCKTCPTANGIQTTSICGWYEIDEECSGIQSCYIPSDTIIQNERGTLRFDGNCHYNNN